MDSLEPLVRKADYDRYLAALFAPEAKRGDVFALYAFNYEVARIPESVSEPMLGHIRLQWWRETIDELYHDLPRRHDVAIALYHAVESAELPRALFDALLDAREADLEREPFADLAALESYAEATSGGLMRLAARVLGAGETLDGLAGEIGIAYALTGILRAIPYHAAQGRVLLPRDLLIAAGISHEAVVSGRAEEIHLPMDRVAAAARARLRLAHLSTVPRRHLPALLPGALAAPYLKVLTRPDFDPFHEAADLSVPRRQLALLSAMMRGRI